MQKEGSTAKTGTRTPSAIVPKEEQAGVNMIPHGDHPADGRDLGIKQSLWLYPAALPLLP
jgi:hypothetical protein